jgi:hypothetical protein
MEFQIEQNYGRGSKAWIYFTIVGVPNMDMLEKVAVKNVIDEWQYILDGPQLTFAAPSRCRPTIKVREHKDGKRVKGGIEFKTKWR